MSSIFPTGDEGNPVKETAPAFHLKTGDTGPPLQVRFTDDEGDAIELDSEDDEVTLYVETESGEPVALENEAEIENGEEGVVIYEWDEQDTDTPGRYYAEFRLTFDVGEETERVETFPNSTYITIKIQRSLESE